MRLSLKTLFEYQKVASLDQTFEGIFYGTMIAMVLYNLILFAVIRYRIYLFYVFYQLGTFIHWSFIDGTSNQMIQDGIGNPLGWRIFWAGFLGAANFQLRSMCVKPVFAFADFHQEWHLKSNDIFHGLFNHFTEFVSFIFQGVKDQFIMDSQDHF